jgi:hypothetical protein
VTAAFGRGLSYLIAVALAVAALVQLLPRAGRNVT